MNRLANVVTSIRLRRLSEVPLEIVQVKLHPQSKDHHKYVLAELSQIRGFSCAMN